MASRNHKHITRYQSHSHYRVSGVLTQQLEPYQVDMESFNLDTRVTLIKLLPSLETNSRSQMWPSNNNFNFLRFFRLLTFEALIGHKEERKATVRINCKIENKFICLMAGYSKCIDKSYKPMFNTLSYGSRKIFMNIWKWWK